jgi:hypothetical protein
LRSILGALTACDAKLLAEDVYRCPAGEKLKYY